ncbi:MAG: PRD domain-containing protein [Lactobacillus sp.]|jgi:mannitol operon transcriptional antiterminator|nr:PRD domain-containing protein [Lactobacillus sp.]
MDLSNREAEITLLLLRNPQGLSIAGLMKGVNVSRRTIYRELSSLETSLAHLAIQLAKEDGAYHLVADDASIAKLKKQLINTTKSSFSSVMTRQSALVCRLLMSDTILTTKTLAAEFEVSGATITQDLNAIEPIFKDYNLVLERIPAKGIRVYGQENNIRRVISGVLSSEINEYEFFEVLNSAGQVQLPDSDSRYFIQLLPANLLQVANQAMSSKIDSDFSSFSDSQIKQLTIILTVSAERIGKKKFIKSLDHVDKNVLFKYQRLAISLYQHFDHDIADHISMVEIEFLAQQIHGMSFKLQNNLLLDNYDLRLSYQVRSLIQEVSKNFKYDFRNDDTLFEDLFAHISATLRRQTSQLPEVNNPVLENVVGNYPKLYKQVRRALHQVFAPQHVSDSESAYILLHFASAFEQQRQGKPIRALVICANGVGTAKVLEHRLKKMVPEISDYRVSRVAELNKIKVADYDLILSTIFLPGFNYPYKVISPLLLSDEVKDIKNDLVAHFGVRLPAKATPLVAQTDTLQQFDSLVTAVTTAKAILDMVVVEAIDNRQLNLEQTLLLLCKRLRPKLLTNAQVVSDALYQRMAEAPVGIPGTGMALVHTTHQEVKAPFFAIYNLSHPLVTQGMDYQDVTFSRALFMIAPKELPTFQADLLGDISGSIVDNDLNLSIYQQGDTAAVKQLISRLFLNRIKG